MLGEDIYAVFVNGTKYKGDMTLKQAETLAERHQRGLLKHKDLGDHVEIKRDTQIINEVNEMYKTAKAGDRQTYKFVQTVE